MTYNVFYNSDCGKYGVADENGKQVLICKHIDERPDQCFCYSKYKGIAEKYAKKLNLGYYFVFSYADLINKKTKNKDKMTVEEIKQKYADYQYQFEEDCRKCLKNALKKVDNKYQVFEPFCENIDAKFYNPGESAAYVRILWGTDTDAPDELAEELLDIAKRFNVIQYCIFYNGDDIVIVAVYEQN